MDIDAGKNNNLIYDNIVILDIFTNNVTNIRSYTNIKNTIQELFEWQKRK